MNIQEILHNLQGATAFLSLDACIAYHAVRIDFGSQSLHSIYQSLWHIQVYMNAVWISQCWECVQQDAGHVHEEGGQGLMDVLPG